MAAPGWRRGLFIEPWPLPVLVFSNSEKYWHSACLINDLLVGKIRELHKLDQVINRIYLGVGAKQGASSRTQGRKKCWAGVGTGMLAETKATLSSSLLFQAHLLFSLFILTSCSHVVCMTKAARLNFDLMSFLCKHPPRISYHLWVF